MNEHAFGNERTVGKQLDVATAAAVRAESVSYVVWRLE